MTKCLALMPLLLLAACGGSDGAARNAPDPVATVRTAPAIESTTSDTVTLYGVAEAGPGNERAMAVQTEATLARILAPTGTAVRTGQIVAILRPSAASRLDAAKAASDAVAAVAALARARRLRADGLMSDADVETARAAAVTASATRASTAQREATLTLRAPASGTVQALTAKPGDVIAAGTMVATIAMGSELRARLGIDPARAAEVRAGQLLRLGAAGASPALVTRVAGVDPQVDTTTRLASVFARIPAASGLGVGQALRATLTLGAAANGLTIPYAALLDDGGRSYVFVVAQGVARARDVIPGNSAGDRIQIVKGLAPGDRVVTEGGTALEDGMKVKEQAGAAR